MHATARTLASALMGMFGMVCRCFRCAPLHAMERYLVPGEKVSPHNPKSHYMEIRSSFSSPHLCEYANFANYFLMNFDYSPIRDLISFWRSDLFSYSDWVIAEGCCSIQRHTHVFRWLKWVSESMLASLYLRSSRCQPLPFHVAKSLYCMPWLYTSPTQTILSRATSIRNIAHFRVNLPRYPVSRLAVLSALPPAGVEWPPGLFVLDRRVPRVAFLIAMEQSIKIFLQKHSVRIMSQSDGIGGLTRFRVLMWFSLTPSIRSLGVAHDSTVSTATAQSYR